VAVGEELGDDGRADVTGGSGDEHAHGGYLSMMSSSDIVDSTT
jgi:hypothetical protein